jgi:hypothetical protein
MERTHRKCDMRRKQKSEIGTIHKLRRNKEELKVGKKKEKHA